METEIKKEVLAKSHVYAFNFPKTIQELKSFHIMTAVAMQGVQRKLRKEHGDEKVFDLTKPFIEIKEQQTEHELEEFRRTHVFQIIYYK